MTVSIRDIGLRRATLRILFELFSDADMSELLKRCTLSDLLHIKGFGRMRLIELIICLKGSGCFISKEADELVYMSLLRIRKMD